MTKRKKLTRHEREEAQSEFLARAAKVGIRPIRVGQPMTFAGGGFRVVSVGPNRIVIEPTAGTQIICQCVIPPVELDRERARLESKVDKVSG